MQLKRESVETCRVKSIIQKGIIPARINPKTRNLQTSRPCQVPLYFAQCSFTEMKSTFIKLQNESLQKDIGQELLIVNNSV